MYPRISLDDVQITVDSDDGPFMTLYPLWKKRQIGYAYTEFKPGSRLQISDIKIDDDVRPPWTLANRLLVLLRLLPRTINFRGRGIGSLLIERLITEARARGVVEIYGSIRDGRSDPSYLKSWYRRLGFSIEPTDSECIEDAACKIVLRL